MSPRWKRFRRGPDHTLVVSLAPAEMDLLVGLPAELRGVFDAPAGDPGAARLFPRAYLDPTEEEAEAEYEALVQPDLLRQRLDALELVTASFDRAVEAGEWREVALTPDDVGAWLGVLNDTRLVLGTRLDVTEGELTIADDDPNAAAYRIYAWLTSLQGELVEQLLG
ncbi:MAG: DUF2017 family protein [Acidimicrobiia bacterium]